ncbi:MAG: chemotaxis protein CheA [Bacteroidota bacterium]
MTNRDELKKLFAEESNELLDQIEQICIECPVDRIGVDQIAEIYRTVHSLKGSARMFGFEEIEHVYHDLEDILDYVREHPSLWSTEIRAMVLECIDWTRWVMGSEKQGDEAINADTLSQTLQELKAVVLGRHEAEKSNSESTRSELSHNRFKIVLKLNPNAIQQGVEPIYLLEELNDLGIAQITFHGDAIPEYGSSEPNIIYGFWIIHLDTEASLEVIKDVFLFTEDTSEIRITSIGRNGNDDAEENNEQTDHKPGQAKQSDGAKSGGQKSFIKVETNKLDRLLNVVGELVINQSQIQNSFQEQAHLENQHVVEEQDRLLTQLRTVVMDMRMVPIDSLFLKIKRVVHDLSESTGKSLVLKLDGGETEIDKKVIDRLAEPVMHLIRNAADHGIEDGEIREDRGKPKEGTIYATAGLDNGEFSLVIGDDGGGLDLNKIKQIAIEKRVIPANASPSQRELTQLIFEPALSTAESISSISGRGMGMDVVRRRIESLNGSIQVQSKPAEGTEFHIRLPMTLSIMECLLVGVGNTRYAIPVRYIDHCQQLSIDQIRSQRDMINLDGQPITLVRLAQLVGGQTTPSEQSQMIVIRYNEQKFGVMVDQIMGTLQAVLKPLHNLFETVDMVSAGTILGDGAVGYILDMPALLNKAQSLEQEYLENEISL